ncbi:hypothetical protein Csa_011359 [Cucumis sativus]|uniref:Uncharacterized protein n=1 Tax=Cucumis sativus TaxID=3659 RepID=A0A0A0LA58_CUCSA|nr:hypothetical protein Csa_011359 [Cucumis sativus]
MVVEKTSSGDFLPTTLTSVKKRVRQPSKGSNATYQSKNLGHFVLDFHMKKLKAILNTIIDIPIAVYRAISES